MNNSVLVLDENSEYGEGLTNLLHSEFGLDVTYFDNIDEAKESIKLTIFSLIILDPFCPSSFEGEDFISTVKMFNSINVNTPMIIFTEDIEFVSHISEKYQIHPETKLGPITKILNPIKMLLKL